MIIRYSRFPIHHLLYLAAKLNKVRLCAGQKRVQVVMLSLFFGDSITQKNLNEDCKSKA